MDPNPVIPVRFEIRIDAHDPEANSGSSFMHAAYSGNPTKVEPQAHAEFERVKRAMQGQDEEIYADHFVTARLLKGDSAEISTTVTQEVIETYTRGQ